MMITRLWHHRIVIWLVVFWAITTAGLAKEQSIVTPFPVDRWILVGESAIGLSRNALVAVHQSQIETFPLVEGLVVRVVKSPQHKYWAALRIFPLPPSDRTPRKVWVSIFQGEKRLYNIPLLVAYDAPLPEIAINDAGDLVIARREVATVSIFHNGQLVRKPIRLFANGAYDLERIVYVQPMQLANGFVVAATRHGMDQSQQMEPYLFSIQSTGQIKWQQAVNAHAIGRLEVSENGKWIALSAYRFQGHQLIPESRVYNTDGKPLMVVDIIFKTAAFTEKNHQIALANNDTLVLLDLSKKEIRWRKQMTVVGEMITALQFNPTGNRLAVLLAKNQFMDGKFQFMHPRILVVSPQGDQLYQQTFPQAVFQDPALFFKSNPDQIVVGFQKTIQTIGIDQ